MGRDGGLADLDGLDDLAHVHRRATAGQQRDDLHPGGVGQGLEPGGVLDGCGAVERPFLRMYRGRLETPGKPRQIYAITGPEFG